MRVFVLLPVLTLMLGFGRSAAPMKLPTARPNPNTAPAGRFRGSVLTIALDAKLTMWHPDGDSLPGIPIEAFAERGRPPQVPGPLIRVTEGTEIQASVLNSLEGDTLTFYFQWGDAADSLVIPPGMTREIRVRANKAGTFFYRATTSNRLGRMLAFGGLLAGAVVADPSGAMRPLRDRIFVLQVAADSTIPGTGIPLPARSVWAINGRAWPHTERITAIVGDTLHWRLINASNDQHPMHLHGSYYRVDAFDGPAAAMQDRGASGRRVVTERMSQFTTMVITWVPERAGNWLFHCHFQEHATPHPPLEVVSPSGERQRIASAPSHREMSAHGNHALTGMGGLVLGIRINPRRGQGTAATVRAHRRLRLVAIQDDHFPDSVPSMRFVLEDPQSGEHRVDAGPGSSPPIYLIRGEPVSITVVNQMHEATAVHWHGIELESYFDGVADFSGSGRKLAPIIAPQDSFEARFTPPRAGTFIYHSHVDEPRQHRAGLVGALIVRDTAMRSASEELILLIKSARAGRGPPNRFEINGRINPDTIVLVLGRKYRLRVIAMQTGIPGPVVSITARPDSSKPNLRDTLIVQWRQIAKDGADLTNEVGAKPARQSVGMGETYDFELVPERRGVLRVEVRSALGLMVRAPIRVE